MKEQATGNSIGTLVDEQDALFHLPAYRDPTWLETNWFSFLIPEDNVRGHVYTGFRTNLGVALSMIVVWSRNCASVVETDYYDSRVHLPLPPDNLDRYRLANGLEVRALEPHRRYTLTYDGFDGMRLEFEYRALMPPVDSRETLVEGGSDFSHFHKVGAAQEIGHIDQTMMVEGTMELRGATYHVAFPSNRDHSWSPRPEHGHGRGYFDEGYFGEDFAFHVQTKNVEAGIAAVTNGYVLEHGEVIGIKSGEGRYSTDGWVTNRLEYELEDRRGRTYRLVGKPTAIFALPTFPNQYNIAGLTRWTTNDAVGWGEYKWHWEVSEMQAYISAGPNAPAASSRSRGTVADNATDKR